MSKLAVDFIGSLRAQQSINNVWLRQHLDELGKPRKVQFFVPEPEHEEQMRRLRVQGVKIYAFHRAAEHHEGFRNLLRMPVPPRSIPTPAPF